MRAWQVCPDGSMLPVEVLGPAVWPDAVRVDLVVGPVERVFAVVPRQHLVGESGDELTRAEVRAAAEEA